MVNHGVFFEPTGETLLGETSSFDLVFSLKIPTLNLPSDIKCRDINGFPHQFGFNMPGDNYAPWCDVFSKSQRPIIRAHLQEIHRLKNSLTDLLADPVISNNSRIAREINAQISDVGSGFLGFVRTSQIKPLASLLNKVIRDLNSLESTHDKELDVLHSSLHHTSQAVDSLQSQLDTTNDQLERIYNYSASISDVLRQVEDDISQVRSELVNVTKSMSTLEQGVLILENLELIKHSYDQFLESIDKLLQGRLPHYLVPTETMKSSLRRIEILIAKKYAGYTVAIKDVGFYYDHRLASSFHHNGSLFIHVQVPYYNQLHKLDLYRLVTQPIPLYPHMPNASGVSFVSNVDKYFAISRNGRIYTTLSEEAYSSCQSGPMVICEHDLFYHHDIVDSCEMALFVRNSSLIKKFCDVKASFIEVRDQIRHLEDNEYLITSNAGFYQVVCPNSPITRMVEKATFFKITLGCQCRLHLGSNVTMMPSLSRCRNVGQGFEVKYPINHFVFTLFGFSDDQFPVLHLSDQPTRLDVPYLPHFHKDLRMGDHTKQIAYDLADLARKTNDIKNNIRHSNYMYSFIDGSASNGSLLASTILTIIAIAGMLIWLVVLTARIGVLRRTRTIAVGAAAASFPVSRAAIITPFRPTSSTPGFTVPVENVILESDFESIVKLIIVVSLMFIVYKISVKCCFPLLRKSCTCIAGLLHNIKTDTRKMSQPSRDSTLLLHITVGDTGLEVPIARIPHPMPLIKFRRIPGVSAAIIRRQGAGCFAEKYVLYISWYDDFHLSVKGHSFSVPLRDEYILQAADFPDLRPFRGECPVEASTCYLAVKAGTFVRYLVLPDSATDSNRNTTGYTSMSPTVGDVPTQEDTVYTEIDHRYSEE